MTVRVVLIRRRELKAQLSKNRVRTRTCVILGAGAKFERRVEYVYCFFCFSLCLLFFVMFIHFPYIFCFSLRLLSFVMFIHFPYLLFFLHFYLI